MIYHTHDRFHLRMQTSRGVERLRPEDREMLETHAREALSKFLGKPYPERVGWRGALRDDILTFLHRFGLHHGIHFYLYDLEMKRIIDTSSHVCRNCTPGAR